MIKKKIGSRKARKLQTDILKLFTKRSSKTLNYKQIAKKLSLKSDYDKQSIVQELERLTIRKRLSEDKRGRYKLAYTKEKYTGTVEFSSHKSPRAITENGKAIIIAPHNLNGALHGDKVEVVKRNHKQGEIVQIIKKNQQKYVGTIEKEGSYALFSSNDRNVSFKILIPPKNLNKAKNYHRIVARLTEYSGKRKIPIGEVVEILGKVGNHKTEMHSILEEYNLPYKFPENIENAANKIPAEIPKKEIKKRKDLRETLTFTIDPKDAKDYDDALSVRTLENGNIEVGVHIADVTYYIQQDDIIDKEAFERGTSVYLVDRVVPMLPERLSNELCSLREKEDKLSFTTLFEIDDNAQIVSRWVGRSVINSNKRFNYEEAQEIIDKKEGLYCRELTVLDKIAKKLRQRRLQAGAINFQRSDIKIELDKNHKPINIIPKQPIDTNHLIEEFMLLANRYIAQLIAQQKSKKTFVYRIHDLPDGEKASFLTSFVKQFGYKLNKKTEKDLAHSINKMLEGIQNSPQKDIIEMLAIRTMSKAEYSTHNIGHYGLAFHHYTHFTSPIRRYPDMIVHRLLQRYLDGKRSASKDLYDEICKHSSEREQIATQAEYASIRVKEIEYINQHKNKIYEGLIAGMNHNGLFVQMKENGITGFLHKEDLPDDIYYYKEEQYKMIGQHSLKTYQLGNSLQVKVRKTDFITQRIRLDFIGEE